MTDDFTGVQKRQNPIEGFFQHNIIRTNPFAANRSAERAYGRSERIVVALHLLTNHVAENEPLRNIIRAHSLELLETILSIRNEMRSPESPRLASLRSSIRFLISLVRMLVVSGSISAQNADIVIESLDDLGNLVASSQRSSLSESTSLLREDLDVPSLIGQQRIPLRDQIKVIKDMSPIKDVDGKKDISRTSVIHSLSDMNSRKQNILEVLRSGGELGIRDIASNVPQYSEKMVQRELMELVTLGKVKKVGLKRWSRYSILQ